MDPRPRVLPQDNNRIPFYASLFVRQPPALPSPDSSDKPPLSASTGSQKKNSIRSPEKGRSCLNKSRSRAKLRGSSDPLRNYRRIAHTVSRISIPESLDFHFISSSRRASACPNRASATPTNCQFSIGDVSMEGHGKKRADAGAGE